MPPTSLCAAGTVDCDVHPSTERGIQSVYPYVPLPWRERFVRKAAHRLSPQPTIKYTHPNGAIQREDARPAGGRPAGSDPRVVIHDLIETHAMSAVILNSLQASVLGASLAGLDEGIVLTAAFNDYFIEQWLALDSRFLLAASVPAHDPQAACLEIERVGSHRQVAAIALPLVDGLLGHRRWWPVYEAAQRHQLPILIHGSGAEGVFQGAPALAGGVTDSYIERFLGMTQLAEAHVTNLVFSGTLERFADLKFVFVEFGFTWLLPHLWRMDRVWRSLRYEVPWVKRSPIDYVHDHCRFTTQPLDEPKNAKSLELIIDLLGDDHLCFSSDYPHWDNEMPNHVLQGLSPAARQKVFVDNARQTFRMS